MSKSKNTKQQAPQQDDDEFEFLLQQAAANKAKIAKDEENKKIPEEIFQSLPTPPSIALPERNFEHAEIMDYNEHIGHRKFTVAEDERLEKLKEALPDLREGGIIHKQVREWAMETGVIRPGVNLNDMCAQIEEAVRRQTIFDPPARGLSFPCGCSINQQAAHYSPLPGDQVVLGQSDVMKIDFGIAVNGYVMDSAFTVCFDDRFKPLIDATVEATNEGIRYAGPDARLSEIGDRIDEVISACSIELNGHVYSMRPVSNLSGHQIGQYRVHCGKSIPISKQKPGYREYTEKMEYGDVFALETFATTGEGWVVDDGSVSHFMINPKTPSIRQGPQSQLVNFIRKNFSTMAFCQRFLERGGYNNYTTTLAQLVKGKIVNPYPTLSDIAGSYVSQHEHSFAILEHHKEVFSR